MKVLGIDPGLSGAAVILENGEPIEWIIMPTMKVGSTNRVNAAELTYYMSTGVDHVYIEQVGAMPGQGVASMFNFGCSFGIVLGVTAGLAYPHTLVSPQRWKRAAGLIGTDKDAARARAIQLWPKWRDLDKKGQGQALADAALIALCGSQS